MRKLNLILVITLSATCMQSTQANTGQLTFNGELTANTCNVSVDGGESSNTVTLPTVSVGEFRPFRTAGNTSFSIALSGCRGPLRTASAYFEDGPNVINVVNYNRLRNNGTAENLYIQLRDGSNNEIIHIGGRSQIDYNGFVDIDDSGNASLSYSAEYFAGLETVKAGTAMTSVSYSVMYK